MNTSDFLDFDEAVIFLKTTPSTLYKWLQAGKVPGHKLGRQWRFSKDELELHVSGKGAKINLQKDFISLQQILNSRASSNKKENSMNQEINHLTEQLIWDAFDHGSRLIHLYPSKGKYEISYRGKSGLDILSTIQEDFFYEIDSSLQAISTEISEADSRRLYLHRNDNDVLQVRYQKLETVTGPRLTLRIWQPEKDVLPLEKITTKNSEAYQNFQNWLKKTSGLFIVTGASGAGKTTTVYTLLNEYKNLNRLVFSIEETVELIIEGINQIEIKSGQIEKFESVFSNVYASDPDVICLGLTSYFGKEKSVFDSAYEAASTGHIVILQMHSASCDEALKEFNKFCSYSTDKIIAGVLSQKLTEENNKVKAEYSFS